MDTTRSHLFVARGGGQLASWLDVYPSTNRVPQVRMDRLASRYLQEVKHGSFQVDLLLDDSRQYWLVLGVTRPFLDGHRRDEEFVALLVPWEDAVSYLPLDYGKLLKGLLRIADHASRCTTSADLAQSRQLQCDWESLLGETPCFAEDSKNLLEGIATGEKARAHVGGFNWGFLSAVLSLFPPAFGRHLRVLVTDAGNAVGGDWVVLSTETNPLADSSWLTGRCEIIAPRQTTAHPYVAWLTEQRSDLSSIWDAVRQECEQLVQHGWETPWPAEAAPALLSLVGTLLTHKATTGSSADPVARARLIRTTGSRFPEMRYTPRVRHVVQLPTCADLVLRLLNGEGVQFDELCDAISVEPLLSVLQSLWCGVNLPSLAGSQVAAFAQSLPESLRDRFAIEQPERLLRDPLPKSCLAPLCDWVIRPAVIPQLSDERPQMVFPLAIS